VFELLSATRDKPATAVIVGLLLAMVLAISPARPAAADSSALLRLDGHSYISFSPSENPPLAPGSTIRFRFGNHIADGSVAVRVEPEDVSIAPVSVTPGFAIEYGLSEAATGRAWIDGQRLQIELSATLVATLRGGDAAPPLAYRLLFTTGLAEASSANETDSVAVSGQGASTSRYIRLVGAATNLPDAFPGPGEAVYAVLSGSFDSLPHVSED
jgi:hypothetical protein